MGLSSLELCQLAGDELNVIELYRSKNVHLCRQLNLDGEVHSRSQTNSLCKSLSGGQVVPTT